MFSLFSVADVGSLASKPKLPEFFNLRTSSGSTVNIVKQIGTHYTSLGPQLLNDDNGAVTTAITNEHKEKADAINQEILTRWLRGQGKKPVTWSTLIDVLRDVELSELADEIQVALTGSAQPFGETVLSTFCQSWYTTSSFSLHCPSRHVSYTSF